LPVRRSIMLIAIVQDSLLRTLHFRIAAPSRVLSSQNFLGPAQRPALEN
jgi:hypothetical protein